jgi:colanic acid/amylovoran biosynthesis protein
MPDVAFVLDPHEPENVDIGSLEKKRKKDSIVVGLNISGLLFNGGYNQDNMFGLKMDYRELVYDVIDSLMEDKRVLVLLVPHVFAPGWPVEDDPAACAEVYEQLNQKYPGRVFLTRGQYNHAEIKHVIGLCDFFIGSRMHACIAALSQCIPAVGIAYSKKFQGVFGSIGLESCVAEAYRCGQDEILSIVMAEFENHGQNRTRLNEIIPEVKANILSALDI